jgi:hypothetical protein
MFRYSKQAVIVKTRIWYSAICHIRSRWKYYLDLSLLLGLLLMGCSQLNPHEEVVWTPAATPLPAMITKTPQDISSTGWGVLVNISTSNGRESFNKNEAVTLHVIITNSGSSAIRILKWFTPLEGVDRSLFTVLRDGEPVAYMGRLVKRPAPTPEDYITLSAGGSLNCDINISEYYDLTVPGRYELKYAVSSLQLFEQPTLGSGNLTSNSIYISIK